MEVLEGKCHSWKVKYSKKLGKELAKAKSRLL